MQYVIIGSSAAGISAIEAIRTKDKASKIIVISDEKKFLIRIKIAENPKWLGVGKEKKVLSFDFVSIARDSEILEKHGSAFA